MEHKISGNLYVLISNRTQTLLPYFKLELYKVKVPYHKPHNTKYIYYLN